MTQDTPQDTSIADDARMDALRKAADGGDAEAMHRLGIALVSGNASDEAFALQLRAAETGHVDAQIYLARMLLYGIVAAPQPDQAVQWLLRAERAGSAIAGYHLASIALGGLALPRDARINERLHAAMRAEYAPALRAVAIHFGRKAGDDDQTLCVQLLERAAHAGDAIAAALLAERLGNGEGVDAAPAAAAELRAQLAARGIEPLPALRMPLPQQGALLPRELAIEEALRVPPSRQLSNAPRVAVVDGLLSADECRLLIAATRPELRESRTVDPDTGLPISIQIRTSSDASLDPLREDFALRCVQLRMAAAAGIDLANAEHMTVLRYAPGQEYRPHRDYLPPGAIERDKPQAGNRVRTICTYLNPVDAGGETEFSVPGVRVSPQPGRAVIFDNLRPDGTADADSLHAGLPVERGEKWLATLWIRQGVYRDF